ncbi:MAG: class I SAM-dependent methyltransferase [Solirubrobacterales bacterium]
MKGRSMREFWDARADEDAFYFVDSRLAYGSPDAARFWSGGEEDLDRLLGTLGVRVDPGDELVEIGCGVGRLTRVLSERAGAVWALDVSSRMLELAREHNPDLDNVRWVEGNGTSLEGIADQSADGCISLVVFQHIPDPEVTLGYVREIGRVLKPGGWAGFQLSNRPAIHRARPLLERLRALPRRLRGKAPAGQTHAAWLGSAVDLETLAEAAGAGGCELARVSGEGTQWCAVLLRKRGVAGSPPRPRASGAGS